MNADFMTFLFQTCRHLQERALRTRKAEDIRAWMAKTEQIEDAGLERLYEQWYIEQQEERVKEWNVEQLLKSVGLLR